MERRFVAARKPQGIVYGAGEFLRRSIFANGKLEVASAHITSAPEKSLRPIYFATHFGNWYCHATIGDIRKYIEDLALWGYNGLITWFDLHHYRGLDDGADHWHRLVELDRVAKEIGMKTGRIAIANESFAGQASPELRAVGRLEGTGYETDLCPSKAEARRIILDDRRAFLEKIAATTELDWLCLWPYDQGGCNCHQCTPWPVKYMETLQGDRGVDLRPPYGDRTDSECLVDWCPSAGRGRSFLRVIGATGALVRNHCRRNRRNPALALSGAKGSRGLRSLAFSEISMFDALPRGSRGANPSPRKFATEMKDLEPSLTGAMPYSEGRYEDVNKVVWAQLLWNRRRDPGAILADYCRYSFGPEAADTGARLLFDLEEGLRDLPSAPKRYEDALALESRMEEWGRAGWRWQVVRARAAIDALKWEIQSTDTPEDRRSQAATELRVVYEHLQHELYLHDGDRSLRNWIWLPFDVWVKLPFNALVLPLESA